MSCYFLVDTYIDEKNGRGLYDDYIEKVKPIVESFGGEYLLRTENITSLSPSRTPQRVIVIRFPSRERLDSCFASEEYRAIMHERAESVDARALIAEQTDGEESEEQYVKIVNGNCEQKGNNSR